MVKLTSRFNIEEDVPPTKICYAHKHPIIITGHCTDETYFKMVKVFHKETGVVLKEFKKCHATSSLMPFEIEGKEYLLEGCALCQVIRGYQFLDADSTILKEDIQPIFLFKGPQRTVLSYDTECISILQLAQSHDQFNLVRQVSIVLEDVQNVCYSSKDDIVIALHSDGKTITGFHLATEQIAWQHSEIQFDSPPRVVDQMNNIAILPDGRTCLFNDNKMYALNAENGTILSTVLDHENFWRLWAVSTYSTGDHRKLAIAHSAMEEVMISIYHFSHKLPLREIISE